MIKTYGKIDSLKKIRATLNDRGLSEFNSIGEINTFLQKYDSEVRNIRDDVERQFADEQQQLNLDKEILDEKLSHLRERVIVDSRNKIAELEVGIADRLLTGSTNSFYKVYTKLVLTILRFRQRRIEKYQQQKIDKATAHHQIEFDNISRQLKNYAENKLGMVEQRIASKTKRIDYTKGVIEEINPLIAGAIGESRVEKELQRLSVNGVLLNDYSLKFDPPIYNKRERDRIHSVQLDHLLITGAGIFLLETKNWSEKSIKSLDLRSPVAQIRRSSYAVFLLVNSSDDRSLGMRSHHWGEEQIPIRNLIVMISHKPKEEFKYVKVKILSELNGYIEHFESIYSDEEVNKIANYLKGQQDDNPSQSIKKDKHVSNVRSGFIRNTQKTINDYYKDRSS